MSDNHLNVEQQGKFEISMSDIRHNPDLIIEIFNRLKILVIRAETFFSYQAIVYEAISPSFDEKVPGTEPPYYRIDWKINDSEITYLQIKETRELELSGEAREDE